MSDVLKAKISQLYNTIPEIVMRNAIANVLTRGQSCIAADGDSFRHTL